MPKRTLLRTDRTKAFRLAGVISQGKPIGRPRLKVELPAVLVDSHEVVFRFAGDEAQSINIIDGDLLTVELRQGHTTATGEIVIASIGERAFVGRWWAKHGSRELRAGASLLISDDVNLKILGAVTLVIRMSEPSDSEK